MYGGGDNYAGSLQRTVIEALPRVLHSSEGAPTLALTGTLTIIGRCAAGVRESRRASCDQNI